MEGNKFMKTKLNNLIDITLNKKNKKEKNIKSISSFSKKGGNKNV